MTELGYEVPTIGEKHQASDQRVSTALTEIKTVLNGRLTAGNFAKETLTAKKFNLKRAKWIAEGTIGVAVLAGEKFEKTISLQNTMVSLILQTPAELTTVSILVGGITIAKATTPTSPKAAAIPVGPFRVPETETWAVEVTAGELRSVSEFAYMQSVI